MYSINMILKMFYSVAHHVGFTSTFSQHPIPTRPWWRHQMETFSALLAICAGIHRSPVNSPLKGQWRGALMFYLICAWINDWVNNHEAGDLRHHRAHYDVTVMALRQPNLLATAHGPCIALQRPLNIVAVYIGYINRRFISYAWLVKWYRL